MPMPMPMRHWNQPGVPLEDQITRPMPRAQALPRAAAPELTVRGDTVVALSPAYRGWDRIESLLRHSGPGLSERAAAYLRSFHRCRPLAASALIVTLPKR